MKQVSVIVPNWNGKDSITACLDSLQKQSLKHTVIVVENGSTDGSGELIAKKYPEAELLEQTKNLGYAGGVNVGIKHAIKNGADYVAPFNNDAVADKDWLSHLVDYLEYNPEYGMATSKILSADGKRLDSTGDYYTSWGLPYPRGRGETDINKYDESTEVFGVSGGASLYRIDMLKKIGLFDEKFFAYYEDVDLSFRGQLAGYKAAYVPKSVAYHQIGATSDKIKGFTTYQTMKNLQLLYYKNVPKQFKGRVGRRVFLAETLFLMRAITRGQGWSAFKGDLKGSWLVLKARKERKRIQSSKKVSDDYIWSIIVHDLPPNARALRKLRKSFWRLKGRSK